MTSTLLRTATTLMFAAASADAANLSHLSQPDDPFVFGRQANKSASAAGCVLSGNGQLVVFASNATQLVANDTNGVADVFVRNFSTDVVTRVSLRADGSQSGADATSPVISPDGRYVAFRSKTDLIANNPSDVAQIYLFDRTSLVLSRVSENLSGAPGNGDSSDPIFDADSAFLGFSSTASGLVPGDTNDALDAFIYEIATQQTSRVSLANGGGQGDGDSFIRALSANAELIAFDSHATNLIVGDSEGQRDIFIHDRVADSTWRVSEDLGGVGGDGSSYSTAFSSDGERLVYTSSASNLVVGDNNAVNDAFIYDVIGRNTLLVSADDSGTQGNGATTGVTISGNGTYVAFKSSSTNLSQSNGSGEPQLFIKHVGTQQVTQLTRDDPDLFNIGNMTENGRFVCATAGGSEIVAGDINDALDNFVFDRVSGEAGLVDQARVQLPSLAGDGSSLRPDVSGDGQYVAFDSRAVGLDEQGIASAAGARGNSQIYRFDNNTGDTRRLTNSVVFASAADGSSSGPAISSDGRFVVFESRASDLVLDSVDGLQLYRVDADSGATAWISQTDSENGTSGGFDISGTGQFVVFDSPADDLVADDTNGRTDIFLWSAAEGIQRLNLGSGDEESNENSAKPRLSSDGTHIVFESRASNLVADDANGDTDVFVVEVSSGDIERVSVSSTGAQAQGGSFVPDVSADGRHVVFVSLADDLVPNDIDVGFDVFLKDRSSGVVTRVTEQLGALGLSVPEDPRLSEDGLTVVFRAQDSTGVAHLLRYRHDTGELATIIDGETAFQNAVSWAVNSDGSRVVTDWIDRLLPTDVNDITLDDDIYGVELLFGNLSISQTAIVVDEDAGSIQFEVARNDGQDGLIQLDYATVDGSAEDGEDYNAVSGTLEWQDGISGVQLIQIPILDQSSVESSETFELQFNAPRGGALMSTLAVEITIEDDDEDQETPIFRNGFE